MTKREELDLFLLRADEFIEGKYILADVKIINLLKAIAGSDTLLAIFKNCLDGFDYETAKNKYLLESKVLSENRGEFVLPQNTRELLALIFNLLVKTITCKLYPVNIYSGLFSRTNEKTRKGQGIRVFSFIFHRGVSGLNG